VQVQYDSLLIFKVALGEKKNVASLVSKKLLWKLFFFSTFVKWLYKASLIICQIFLPVTFPFWKSLFFSGKEEAKIFSPLLIFSLTVKKSHGKWIFHSDSLSWGKSKIFFTHKKIVPQKRGKNWSCVILLFKVLQTTFVMGYYGDKSFYEVHEIGKTTLFVEACKSYWL